MKAAEFKLKCKKLIYRGYKGICFKVSKIKKRIRLRGKVKQIALTFDDGPSPEWTPVLLDGLKERNVKAAFFVVGENVSKYPEIVRRMQREGHIVGNHTWNHPHLPQLDRDKVRQQLDATNEIIFQIIGTVPKYMRPPYGEIPDGLEEMTDMQITLWDMDPWDWNTSSEKEVVKKLLGMIDESGIVLLHDLYGSSVKAALEVIDIVSRKKDFKFVRLDELKKQEEENCRN